VKKPKIVFFGSDHYSVLVLNQICNDERFKVVGISTHVSPSPVKDYARTLFEIKFTVTKKFDKKFQGLMKELRPDVGILVSYGKVLPKEILAIPKHGILNIHPSLLPKYRGPSPVQTAILNGDKVTGVTIFKMDEKVDQGPILAQFKEEIKADDTAKSLYERLYTNGSQVLLTILPAYLKGQAELRPQNHKKATYSKKLTREDGKINWKKSDDYLERFIRAMFPWPGAWTVVRMTEDRKQKAEKRLKVLKAHLKKGKLALDKVQLEGKNPVTWKQFQEGYPKAKIIK